MRRAADEHGFSLVEMLTALFIFSLVSTAFLSVMMSGARGTDDTRRSVRISEEARLGLNRMVRDIREAGWLTLPGPNPNPATEFTSFTVSTDYDRDGTYANATGAATAESNYEVVTYAYDDATDTITLTAAGFPTETLIRGVRPVTLGDGTTKPVFSFTSNRLEYDWDPPAAGGQPPGDGVTTLVELNGAACAQGGSNTSMDVCNSHLVDKELSNITSVTLMFDVWNEGRSSRFVAEAQLRNRR